MKDGAANAGVRTALVVRRQALHITQKQVASLAGISRSHYTKIEAGVRTPTLDIARRIACALRAGVDELFFDQTGDATSHSAAP